MKLFLQVFENQLIFPCKTCLILLILLLNNFITLCDVNVSASGEHDFSSISQDDSTIDFEDGKAPLKDTTEATSKQPDDVGSPLFVDTTVSQNSGVSNDIINGSPQIVVSLQDTATAELELRANISAETEIPFSVDASTVAAEPNEAHLKNVTQLEEGFESNKPKIDVPVLDSDDNETKTEEKNEDIPSFSEWAQKRLKEAEKNDEHIINASLKNHTNGKTGSGTKHRWKNYASLDCGAKVIAANPEAGNPGAILSPSRDEYNLNTCTSRIWFIVELCEAIQAKRIDLANFELFSSSPKDFAVSISDRLPSREWSNVGHFTAKDERDVQSFELNPHLFGKFIKVEIKSHYGSEHFCPISLFRVFGTSEFEVLQKEESVHPEEDDEDDDIDDSDGESSKNLFSSATDAVISIVKKAAEVLGNKANNTSENGDREIIKEVDDVRKRSTCMSPSHLVVCNNCSDKFFSEVYELLSCKLVNIKKLVSIPIIAHSLHYSDICQHFGLKLKIKQEENELTSNFNFISIQPFFSSTLLAAMCNVVATMENRIALNVSQQYPNITQTSIPIDKLVSIETSEPHSLKIESTDYSTSEKSAENKPTDELKVDVFTIETAKGTCSTDPLYVEKINPTKAMTTKLSLDDGNSIFSSEIADNEILEEPPESIIIKTTEYDEKIQKEQPAESVIGNTADNLPEMIDLTTESGEGIDEHLDNFISDFGVDQSQNNANQASPSTSSPHQKESVFLRLSNRIKALERNMSLSGQYLEELSKRYKKQVEEMQKLLDKTTSIFHEQTKKNEEKNRQLEVQLQELTIVVQNLVTEKQTFRKFIYWMIFISIIFLVLWYFKRSRSFKRTPEPGNHSQTVEIERRKSIDVISPKPVVKVRRPSDQCLKIVRSAMLASDEDSEKKQFKERRRKRKKNNLKRSSSVITLNEEAATARPALEFQPEIMSSRVFERPDAKSSIENGWLGVPIIDVPIVLDESEHSTLEELSLNIDTIYANLRFEMPAQIESHSMSEKVGSSDSKPGVKRKSASLDESVRKKSPVPSVNGACSIASSNDEQKTPKKEKKRFKKLFKKVF